MRHLLIAASLGFATFAATGCKDEFDFSKVVGSYNADVTVFDKTDKNILTLTQGSGGTLLFSFTTGIHADPEGTSPNGIRASIRNGDDLKFFAQSAFLDHANGTSKGTITGDGTFTTIEPQKIDATLNFNTADLFDFIQPADMGQPPLSDMGGYLVTIKVKATAL